MGGGGTLLGVNPSKVRERKRADGEADCAVGWVSVRYVYDEGVEAWEAGKGTSEMKGRERRGRERQKWRETEGPRPNRPIGTDVLLTSVVYVFARRRIARRTMGKGICVVGKQASSMPWYMASYKMTGRFAVRGPNGVREASTECIPCIRAKMPRLYEDATFTARSASISQGAKPVEYPAGANIQELEAYLSLSAARRGDPRYKDARKSWLRWMVDLPSDDEDAEEIGVDPF
ncbi:hypothetical protein B0H11DRAFT_1912104 [Mycena galericulata]|nr:hypothetical protein B0H11DRAFT_1912104 [Mycena galericulata]